jgi:hypothetical protein
VALGPKCDVCKTSQQRLQGALLDMQVQGGRQLRSTLSE